MIDDNSNRVLMSDSLKGLVPELEEESFASFNDAFVVMTLEISTFEGSQIVIGSLDGISFESLSELKIDIRVNVKEAYDIIKLYTKTGISSRMLLLHLGDDEISLQGPYKISNPKMMSFDHQNRMCTLGLDLIKI